MLRKFLILTLLSATLSAAEGEILADLQQKLYLRDYDAVIQSTENLLRDDLSNVNLMVLQARALYYDGQIKTALSQYEKAYELAPTDHEISFDYAQKLSQSGSSFRAAEVYKSMYTRDSSDMSIVRPYARIVYDAGEFHTAITLYNAIIHQNPEDWVSHRFLAKCFAHVGEEGKSRTHFELAYEIVPDNTNLIYDYAMHEYRLNRLDHTLDLLSSLNENDSGTMKIMLLKADTYFKQQEYTLAIPIYNKLLMKGLRSEDVYKRMGFAYFIIGAYPRSHELLTLSVEMGDRDAATYYYMAKCLEYSKEYDEAIATFEKCLESIQPKYLADLHESMGSIYAVIEDYHNAIDHLSIAREMNQDSHLILYFLADAYDNYYEDKSVALEYFRLAREGSISPRIDEYIDHRIANISANLFLKQ